MFKMAQIIVLGLLLSSIAFADDDDWGEYRDHHHGHHHRQNYYPSYREEVVYMPQRVVEEEIVYVPEQVVEYVPVQPRYYAPPPPPVNYYGYDQRSTQGLVGGMVGSVMGYEMGRGDPLAAGIGAAAGAWIGNGRY